MPIRPAVTVSLPTEKLQQQKGQIQNRTWHEHSKRLRTLRHNSLLQKQLWTRANCRQPQLVLQCLRLDLFEGRSIVKFPQKVAMTQVWPGIARSRMDQQPVVALRAQPRGCAMRS